MSMTKRVVDALPDPGESRHTALFERLARFSVRRRRTVMLVWLLVAIAAAPLALTLTSGLSGAGWEPQGTESTEVRDELRSDFAALGAESAMVVVRQEASAAGATEGLGVIVDDLLRAPGVAAVTDPTALPPEAGLISPDGTTVLIPVALEGEVDEDLPHSAELLIEHVEELEVTDGTTIEVTGEWPVWADFNATNEEALHKAELLSGLPTLILLFVAFGTAYAAGVPLILAVGGIAVGFAALRLTGMVIPLSVWSMNFSMMIGLAVGIDYSLFIVSRYREEREDGYDTADAMANALTTSGKAVFLSALTVVLSLAAVFVVPVMVFRSMALGMILSVAAVALASLTLLPAVLAAMGDRVLVDSPEDDADRAAEGRWARWTGMALSHPGRTLTLGLVLLGILAAPAIGMRLGMPGRARGGRGTIEPRRLRDGAGVRSAPEQLVPCT